MGQSSETGSENGTSTLEGAVREDLTRLTILQNGSSDCSLNRILSNLKDDQVTLIQNVSLQEGDRVVCEVASALDLRAQLELQATFASVNGVRSRVGKYFMTVNPRLDYQFIPPHSESTEKTAMQLACFYCEENTTDGGTNILLNGDDCSPMWSLLRGIEKRVSLNGRKLTAAEIAIARMKFQIRIPEDLLSDDDEVIAEKESAVPGFRVFKVLVKTKKAYSKILNREVNVYWDNVSSGDLDCGKEYIKLLRSRGLLKEPPNGVDEKQMDYNHYHNRRLRSSGITYGSLFKSIFVRKLKPGELVIVNNLTWAHSSSNWTPGIGNRRVAVAFA